MTFFVCASMLPAWISFRLSVKFFGQRSLRLIVNAYLIVTTACTTLVKINVSCFIFGFTAPNVILLPSHCNRFALDLHCCYMHAII